MCHYVHCIWPLFWYDFATRSGGAQMRSSAAYPLSFGRLLLKSIWMLWIPDCICLHVKRLGHHIVSANVFGDGTNSTPRLLFKAPAGSLKKLRTAAHHSQTCKASSRVASEIPVCNLMQTQKPTYKLGMVSTHIWGNIHAHIHKIGYACNPKANLQIGDTLAPIFGEIYMRIIYIYIHILYQYWQRHMGMSQNEFFYPKSLP